MASGGPTVSYKDSKPFAERKRESQEILNKFPGHVPVIICRDPRSNLPEASRPKCLVPADLTVSHFVFVVRQRVELGASDAIFLFFGRKLSLPNESLGSLYHQHKDSDGFLYVTYRQDAAYG
jgi:hypothetical protein